MSITSSRLGNEMSGKSMQEIEAFDWGALTPQQLREELQDYPPVSPERERIKVKYAQAVAARPRALPLDTIDSTRADGAVLQNLGLMGEPDALRAKEEYLLPFWAEYFFKEANLTDGEAARAVLGRFVVKTRQALQAAGRTYALTPEARLTPALEPVNPDHWRAILLDLLKIGFRAVDPRSSEDGEAPVPLADGGDALINCMMDVDFIHHVKQTDFSKLELFLRGEKRPWSAIVRQGTRRMSAVDDLRRDLKIDQSWHPYHGEEINRYLWYRRGQNDNDYFTIVSVAMDIKDAACYPKINEERVYKFPRRPLQTWNPAERTMHRDSLALVSLQNGERKIMIASRITVYMFVVNNAVVLDTKAAGGGYPEKGVEEILIDNIFGWFDILRVHHGPEPEHGFTAFITDTGFNKRDNFDVRVHFGPNGYEHCLKLYRQIRDTKRFQSAWSSMGATAPGVDVQVGMVHQFPVDLLTLQKADAAMWSVS